MEAALRELREETQLAPVKAERLFDHEGTTQIHKVVWVLTRGKVRLQRKEVSEYKWWDGKERVNMLPSARDIISRTQEGKALRSEEKYSRGSPASRTRIICTSR